MTVVPATEASTLTLICDGCGHALKDIDSRPAHWPVVWALVTRHGWGGSPLMIGLHYCPRCSGALLPQTPTPHEDNTRPASASPIVLIDDQYASVVILRGNLDILVASELAEALHEALRRHHNIVVDLSNVRTIDSTILGLLVRTRQAARDRGGRTFLVAPSGFVATVLHTMRLTAIFETVPTTDEALARLATHLAPANGRPPRTEGSR